MLIEKERRKKTLDLNNIEIELGLATIIRYSNKRTLSEKAIISSDIKYLRYRKPYLDNIY